MSESRDRYDDMIREAFQNGIPQPGSGMESAEPSPLPASVRSKILIEASQASRTLLADRVKAAAASQGLDPADLLELAEDNDVTADAFLHGRASPSTIAPETLARWFWASKLEPTRWKDLLRQATASAMTFAAPATGEAVFGRTTGLDASARSEALLAGHTYKDRDKARRAADGFVQEVLDAWDELSTSGTTS